MAAAKGKRVSRPLTVSRSELLVAGSDQEFRGLVHGLLAFSAKLQVVRERFGATIGLTGIQYTILISVRHLEDQRDVTVKAVAGHLHLSGAFITVETGKLVQLGLISKVQAFRDRRRVSLRITKRGRELLSGLARVQAPVNDALFEFLSAAQFRALAAMMDRMVECGNRALALLDYLAANEKIPAETKKRAMGRP